MVFCCIAIVAVAVLYVCFLWARQLFSGPRRDRNFGANFPPPPRALVSHQALPVYGHTFHFTRLAGSVALLFNGEEDTEYGKIMPLCKGRKLGDCFALYIWGQWRVCIQGPERARKVIEYADLKESFPWTPPIALLGKSCLPFLDEQDAEQLRSILARPLSHKNIIQYASAFAEFAENCLDDIVAGHFSAKAARKEKRNSNSNNKQNGKTTKRNDSGADISVESGDGGGDSGDYLGGPHNSNHNVGDSGEYEDDEDDDDTGTDENSNCLDVFYKLKWEALRSYTFDLIDGPILAMNHWMKPSEQTHGESTQQEPSPTKKNPSGGDNNAATKTASGDDKKKKKKEDALPTRETMLLWMDRIKIGVDTIKMTFGSEWMYIWILNEYGRALNARLHVQSILSKHVSEMSDKVPVEHKLGHAYHDPTTQPIPILTLRENLIRDKEGIFGHSSFNKTNLQKRPRSYSAPASVAFMHLEDDDDDDEDEDFDDHITPSSEFVSPYKTEQDLARPKYENSPALASKRKVLFDPALRPPPSPSRRRFEDDMKPPPAPRSNKKLQKKKKLIPLLEYLLRQQGVGGNGISQAVMCELTIILWMMMDVGNAWTAMALNLLASSQDATELVHEELEHLEYEFGHDELFSPSVLRRMKYMDALIYEAIRLCPAFLGGLKQTQTTIEFEDIGVQLPKNTHIFFSQPTNMKFDVREALGRKPHQLGREFPCVELHGFLPLQGLEVPLMVLQSKVFLITALLKYSPYASKKRTLIRRVKCAFSHQKSRSARKNSNRAMSEPASCPTTPDTSEHDAVPPSAPFTPDRSKARNPGGGGSSSRSITNRSENSKAPEIRYATPVHHKHNRTGTPLDDVETGSRTEEVTQTQAMKLFTKIPFPEPRRVIYLRAHAHS